MRTCAGLRGGGLDRHPIKLKKFLLSFLTAVVLLGGGRFAVAESGARRTPETGARARDAGVTRIRVTSQVVVPDVKRLGINLGFQDFWDAGQMMKNLLYRNPGFEGGNYRTIFHCEAGGNGVCIDRRQGIRFPQDFWNGASFEVLDLHPGDEDLSAGITVRRLTDVGQSAASGRRGAVLSCGVQAGGYGLSLASRGRPPAVGDWVAVAKDLPGDAAAGWWPELTGGARLEAERSDLSLRTVGRQALRIEAAGPGQAAVLKSYFDTLEGLGFIRLRGQYRLSFRAKSIAGARLLHVHVARLAPGKFPNLEQDLRIGPEWADYQEDFAANETGGLSGPVEVSFALSGGEMLLDDVDLEQTGTDAANRTAFRDEVVSTLKELQPGLLRMMSTSAQLGNTIDDLLAPPMARRRGGYSGWYVRQEDIPIGIPEFLELCQTVGAEPWIVVPTAMSREEVQRLAEYMAGSAATPGGAVRAAEGHAEPWTRVFHTIHLEYGNETWNGIYLGEAINDPAAYGRRANAMFAAFRAAVGAESAKFDLVVGAQADWPSRDASLLAAAPGANTMAIGPYLMHSVTHWGNDDELYGPLMAQPEQMSRDGQVHAAWEASAGRRLAVYEVNLHTTEGTAPQEVLDRLTPSAAAGVAVAGHMLRMLREEGIREQMLYSLSQFEFKRTDGSQVRLWGGVVQMGAGGRRRPQFLALSMANRVIAGDLMRMEWSGEIPVHDQPEGNDGVRLKGVHELDAYAFQQGKRHGLVLFNYGLHQARKVELTAPGLGPAAKVEMWRLVSPGPGATNEDAVRVTVAKEAWEGAEIELQPCSMVVLEWME